VLTEEVKTNAYPRASMENLANPNNEGDPLNYIPYYSNTNYPVDGTVRELKSATANPPVSGTTDPNNHWAKLSNLTGGRKTGPGILIKVMAGDKIELACEMWWRGTVSGQSTQRVKDDSKMYVFSKEISDNTVRYLVGKLSEGDAYFNALRKKIEELFPPEVQ